MSLPFLTKLAATKSTLFFTPQLMRSFLSFSVIVGKSTFTPGRFMFFLSPSFALFSHFTCTVPFSTSHESTVNVMLPSAQRIFDPGHHVLRERRVRHRDQILVPRSRCNPS